MQSVASIQHKFSIAAGIIKSPHDLVDGKWCSIYEWRKVIPIMHKPNLLQNQTVEKFINENIEYSFWNHQTVSPTGK